MATWPSTLPQSFLIGQTFTIQRQPQAIASEPSMGPVIRRRRFSSAVETVTGSMYMTSAQWQTLIDFYDNTLKGGVLPFDWKHPVTGESKSFRFIADKEDTLTLAQKVATDLYLVNLKLEMLP